ncbi:MAG TPA: hypothetical protein ACFYEA_03340 [Candidatus Tripitaka californicus]|uniref:hypothetical protein n=1 Tax=Candidatus Tripitaka californicus TaxID=3367616 RepID=UPI00402559B6
MQPYGIWRLLMGLVIMFITLPEVAIPHCEDHHCPMDASQPVHHCPLCCTFSHHFTVESSNGWPLSPASLSGLASLKSHSFLPAFLSDSIFQPPESA